VELGKDVRVTGTGDWTPPPPPGAPTAPPSGPYPGAPGGWGAAPYAPPRRTSPLAIVSLVAGCAQFVGFCVIGSIVAIVTGHIARRQIKRSGEQGAGLALAGLILGYLGIVLTALAITGFAIFVFVFSADITQHAVRDDARAFGRAVVREAAVAQRSPRDPGLLRLVYIGQHDVTSGCCNDDRIRLADGTPVENATPADWERAGWRLEFSRTIFYTRDACLTVPSEPTEIPVVVEGHCAGAG
jgi:hypothetical protein